MATIRYQLTEDEVVRGMLKYRPMKRRFVVAGFLVLLGVLELVLASQRQPTLALAGYIFIAVAILHVLFKPLAWRRAFLKLVRANPVFAASKEVTFNETGIIFVSPFQKSEQPWSYFKGLSEDEHYYYLHIDLLGNVTMLPKSAFNEVSQAELLKYREMLTRA